MPKPKASKKTAAPQKPAAGKVRSLRPSDLDAVVAIDRANVGRSRRGFFEKRLAAVKRDPKMFLTLGVDGKKGLAGFIIARVFEGEFGIEEPVASIDAIGVDPRNQGKGYGRALMAGLEAAMRRRDIKDVMSQELWAGGALVGFLAANGFELAPRWVLERPLTEPINF